MAQTIKARIALYYGRTISNWFLLGTGRMPHPVGGAMGVTLCHCCEKGIPRLDIILLNIHKTTSRWYCMAQLLYFDLDC